MDLKIAARMLAVLFLVAAMTAAFMALRKDGEEAPPPRPKPPPSGRRAGQRFTALPRSRHGRRKRSGLQGGLGREPPPVPGHRREPAMNDLGVIDRFLETFTAYIDSGFGLLGGEVDFLTATLIVIDITLAGLFWA